MFALKVKEKQLQSRLVSKLKQRIAVGSHHENLESFIRQHLMKPKFEEHTDQKDAKSPKVQESKSPKVTDHMDLEVHLEEEK